MLTATSWRTIGNMSVCLGISLIFQIPVAFYSYEILELYNVTEVLYLGTICFLVAICVAIAATTVYENWCRYSLTNYNLVLLTIIIGFISSSIIIVAVPVTQAFFFTIEEVQTVKPDVAFFVAEIVGACTVLILASVSEFIKPTRKVAI